MGLRDRAWAVLAAAFVAAGAAATRADFDAEAWRTGRDVLVPEGARGPMARLAPDLHLWDHAAGPDLRDLRIIRGDADDIGYAVYVPRQESARIEKRPARIFNIARRGGEAAELTADLGDRPLLVNRADLHTSARNFRCAVAVEGSDDGSAWRTLRADGAIFDFTGDAAARFTTVSLPDAKFRYLRFVVAAPVGGEPIRLTGADLWQEVPGQRTALPALVERPVAQKTETPRTRQSWYTLDLGARHVPVSKVVLAAADENFARPAGIRTSDDGKTWPSAGRGFFFRVRADRLREDRLEAEFPEAFGRYVRLEVENGDDPPLTGVGLTVYGRPRYVFFPFEAGRRYRVFYGNPQARSPDYDFARLFEHADRAAAVEARLGPPVANPRFIATREAGEPAPWVRQNQWVLYVALAVAVVVLGFVAVRALRRGTEPPEEKSGG